MLTLDSATINSLLVEQVIDTSGSGTTATFAIDATVATLAGSQTLTNKSLTSPALTGSTSIGTGTTFSALWNNDYFSSNSSRKCTTWYKF